MLMEAVKRLRDAHGACLEIIAFTEGKSLEDYQADRGLQLIVERLLEIVGESINQAAQIDETVLRLLPDAFLVIGMRNRIADGYDVIRNDVIWDSATTDVPGFRQALHNLLDDVS